MQINGLGEVTVEFRRRQGELYWSNASKVMSSQTIMKAQKWYSPLKGCLKPYCIGLFLARATPIG